jgi:hypothetical protein
MDDGWGWDKWTIDVALGVWIRLLLGCGVLFHLFW